MKRQAKITPAVQYTHKDTGERLLDVLGEDLEKALAYAVMIELSGHADVKLVEVRHLPKGKFQIL